MVHDGVAEQGHYFTYVYDRVMKRWWKLNDHNVNMELEQDVFDTAFGSEYSHKSACNMIYISKHIAD
jgi:ubiquitin carboxyl-terminal hydrolase 25/28